MTSISEADLQEMAPHIRWEFEMFRLADENSGMPCTGASVAQSADEHFDHIVPFAKGGSHTAESLRIISKAKNLNKGKKTSSPTDWL